MLAYLPEQGDFMDTHCIVNGRVYIDRRFQAATAAMEGGAIRLAAAGRAGVRRGV